MTVMGICLHDMPENRPIPDGNHRLGAKFRFFAQARAFAAAEDDDFHFGLMGFKRLREFEIAKLRLSGTGIVTLSRFELWMARKSTRNIGRDVQRASTADASPPFSNTSCMICSNRVPAEVANGSSVSEK